MNANNPSRRQKLEAFLSAHPDDAFARYGLAMECARTGDSDAAMDQFARLIETRPEYISGYFQFGQLLSKLGRTEQARQTLTAGIAVAEACGDGHAASEMRGALQSLP